MSTQTERAVIRLENGEPIIFFPDRVERDGCEVWTLKEEHATASRDYYDTTEPCTGDMAERILKQYAARYAMVKGSEMVLATDWQA